MFGKQSVKGLPSRAKVLIIRLSSIGDIIQCMSVVEGIKNTFPESEVHWIVRQDMQKILQADPQIDKLLVFDRKEGLLGLMKFAWRLRKEGYDLVYDAHYNIRSRIIKSILTPFWKQWFGIKPLLVVRKKHRLRRILFFQFGMKNALPNPFRAIASFQLPLKKAGVDFDARKKKEWRFPEEVSKAVQAKVFQEMPDGQKWVTLVPSAAYEMKRWPVEYFKELVTSMPDYHFVVIGGPEDVFCEEICSVAPDRTYNLAGKTSLIESFYIVSESQFVVSADTGFLHAADLFRRNGVALLGPTAFGYPTNEEMEVLKSDLACMPCSKDGSGGCKMKVYKQCMFDIRPEMVKERILKVQG